MSAYVVERHHIVYLVEAAMHPWAIADAGISWAWDIDHEAGTYKRGEIRPGNYARAVEVAQMLWDENVRAVRIKYPDTDALPGPIGEDYKITQQDFSGALWQRIDPVQVIKACDCYEYQSCEDPDYYQTEAAAFIRSLRKRAINYLPGYDEAEWGAPKPLGQGG